jgi:hypothetical protein
MGRKKIEEEEVSGRVMVTRRLDRNLWDRVKAHAKTIVPRTTDTGIIEAALLEYLDRHEKKRGQQ